MPGAHVAPIHLDAPDQLGIEDIAKPDFSDPVKIMPEELPVFWACGVT
jgi:uncharacterized protein YcsI (UPF0317 family)